MMKKHVVLLDMDDVTVKHTEAWLDRFKKLTGQTVEYERLTEWNLRGVMSPEDAELMYAILQEDGFFRHLAPKPGAIKGVRELMQMGLDVVFLTSSFKCAYVQKKEWIEEYLPEFPSDNLILTPRKDLVQGDFLIDDAPHNLQKSPAKQVIVFDAPWNRHLDEYERAYNWSDVLQIIQKSVDTPHEAA